MPLFMDNSSSSSAGHTDETMTVDSTTSPRTSLASRIQRRMRRTRFQQHSKFDTLAKEEQRHLADEIKTCKNYVRNLQTSYNLRTKESGHDIMQVLAKKHATDLSEEISLCEQEFKRMEDSHHSNIQNMDGSAYYNQSRSRSRLFPLLHRTNSLQQQQNAPTAA